MTVKERWRKHVRRAFTEERNHPLYNAIRKYGPEAFTVETIDRAENKEQAQELERWYIAEAAKERLYNLSPGGEADGEYGSQIFWEHLNKNPKAKEQYLEKLSTVKKSSDWSDYEDLAEKAKKWGQDNPREAYKNSHRASRIARAKRLARSKPTKQTTERPLKEKLVWKHRRGEILRELVTAQWAARTPEERKEIGRKISKAQKARYEKIAILPNFDQNKWPYAKNTVLRKIRQGLNRDEIIQDAINCVKTRGSHWRDVREKLKNMGVAT